MLFSIVAAPFYIPISDWGFNLSISLQTLVNLLMANLMWVREYRTMILICMSLVALSIFIFKLLAMYVMTLPSAHFFSFEK